MASAAFGRTVTDAGVATTLGFRSKAVAAVGDVRLQSIAVKFVGIRLPSIETHAFVGNTAANQNVYGVSAGFAIPLPHNASFYFGAGFEKVQTFARIDGTLQIGYRKAL